MECTKSTFHNSTYSCRDKYWPDEVKRLELRTNRRCKLCENANTKLIVVYRGIVKATDAYMGRIADMTRTRRMTRGQIVFVDTSCFMLKIDP